MKTSDRRRAAHGFGPTDRQDFKLVLLVSRPLEKRQSGSLSKSAR
jgi:hypothetical protein